MTPDSPTLPAKRRRKGFFRRCERFCWSCITLFPLLFVHGLTTWAIYVEASLSWSWISTSWKGYPALLLGVSLYLLLNWSYTTAVFTDPGSPLSPPTKRSSSHDYSHVPSDEPDSISSLPSFTVKSTGGARFCKKCQAKKPDRAHHCSTCGRCVLKMDHHCPWLATCVGLRNYKAFLLFCSYTTLFCWLCFGVASTTLLSEFGSDSRLDQGFMAVNMVLLAVLAGILGLVLAGFTGWHISLAMRGQTTIECLEKTRYLSPLRRSMQRSNVELSEDAGVVQRYGQQLAEIHANALPGVTRQEEGEEHPSPQGDLEQGFSAQEAVRLTYDEVERARERQRYEDYLDEQDSEKLPNAFDLGWQRNLHDLFGPRPLYWLLPICNTIGDGWHWEPSQKWLTAREEVRRVRENQWREQELREQQAGWGPGPSLPPPKPAVYDGERHYVTTTNGVSVRPQAGMRSLSKANQILGRTTNEYADRTFPGGHRPGSNMSMKTLNRRPSVDENEDDDHYEVSSDEELGLHRDRSTYQSGRGHGNEEWRDWD